MFKGVLHESAMQVDIALNDLVLGETHFSFSHTELGEKYLGQSRFRMRPHSLSVVIITELALAPPEGVVLSHPLQRAEGVDGDHGRDFFPQWIHHVTFAGADEGH